MRVVAGLGVFVLLTGISGAAQTSPLQWTTALDGAKAVGCPIDMRVRQRAGGMLLSTDAQGRRAETFAARLKLELKDARVDRSGQRMVSATVTVRGWNPKARAVPLDGSGEPNGNRAKTITVPLTGGGLPDASADLWLPGFTAARIVELDSIAYDDGQVWNFSGPASCRVAPDLYMPVDGSN
jgi:hypothetical protein